MRSHFFFPALLSLSVLFSGQAFSASPTDGKTAEKTSETKNSNNEPDWDAEKTTLSGDEPLFIRSFKRQMKSEEDIKEFWAEVDKMAEEQGPKMVQDFMKDVQPSERAKAMGYWQKAKQFESDFNKELKDLGRTDSFSLTKPSTWQSVWDVKVPVWTQQFKDDFIDTMKQYNLYEELPPFTVTKSSDGLFYILPCTSGTSETRILFGSAFVFSDGFWIRSAYGDSGIEASVKSADNLTDFDFKVPLPKKLSADSGLGYEKSVIFPFLASVKNPDKPYQAEITYTFTGCRQPKKKGQSPACVRMRLPPLPINMVAGKSEFSGRCPSIQDFLLRVPEEEYSGLSSRGAFISGGTARKSLQMRFTSKSLWDSPALTFLDPAQSALNAALRYEKSGKDLFVYADDIPENMTTDGASFKVLLQDGSKSLLTSVSPAQAVSADRSPSLARSLFGSFLGSVLFFFLGPILPLFFFTSYSISSLPNNRTYVRTLLVSCASGYAVSLGTFYALSAISKTGWGMQFASFNIVFTAFLAFILLAFSKPLADKKLSLLAANRKKTGFHVKEGMLFFLLTILAIFMTVLTPYHLLMEGLFPFERSAPLLPFILLAVFLAVPFAGIFKNALWNKLPFDGYKSMPKEFFLLSMTPLPLLFLILWPGKPASLTFSFLGASAVCVFCAAVFTNPRFRTGIRTALFAVFIAAGSWFLYSANPVKMPSPEILPNFRKEARAGKTVIVQLAPPGCITCGFSRFFIGASRPFKELSKEGKIETFFLEYRPEYSYVLEQYRLENPPIHLVYTKDEPNGFSLPTYLFPVNVEKTFYRITTPEAFQRPMP